MEEADRKDGGHKPGAGSRAKGCKAAFQWPSTEDDLTSAGAAVVSLANALPAKLTKTVGTPRGPGGVAGAGEGRGYVPIQT